MKSIPELLDDAATVLTERGWYQGGYVPGGRNVDLSTCPVCVLAAINVAADYAPDADIYDDAPDVRVETALAFARHLGLADQLKDEMVAVVVGEEWNDKQARDAEQVAAELRACAAALRAAEEVSPR